MQKVLIHQNLLKNDLSHVKSDADKLNIDKLETVPVELSKLCNAVKK